MDYRSLFPFVILMLHIYQHMYNRESFWYLLLVYNRIWYRGMGRKKPCMLNVIILIQHSFIKHFYIYTKCDWVWNYCCKVPESDLEVCSIEFPLLSSSSQLYQLPNICQYQKNLIHPISVTFQSLCSHPLHRNKTQE